MFSKIAGVLCELFTFKIFIMNNSSISFTLNLKKQRCFHKRYFLDIVRLLPVFFLSCTHTEISV